MTVAWRSLPADHPCLPGHFPGDPIVPAVVILAQVLEAASSAGIAVTGMPAARLLRPLRPEQRFCVELTSGPRGVAFHVRTEEHDLIARGRLASP